MVLNYVTYAGKVNQQHNMLQAVVVVDFNSELIIKDMLQNNNDNEQLRLYPEAQIRSWGSRAIFRPLSCPLSTGFRTGSGRALLCLTKVPRIPYMFGVVCLRCAYVATNTQREPPSGLLPQGVEYPIPPLCMLFTCDVPCKLTNIVGPESGKGYSSCR